MPQSHSIHYKDLQHAKYFQKMYEDAGAKTEIVKVSDGFVLTFKFAKDWQPPGVNGKNTE